MFTKEELESMKFQKLRSIAKQKNMSRRWTTRQEIIDSLLSFRLEEDIDMITVTLVDNSDDTDQGSSPTMEGEKSEPPAAPLSKANVQTETNGRKTRTARRRFPKPRMTVFETEESNNETYTMESGKTDETYTETGNGSRRRFPKPRMTVFQTEDTNNETYVKETENGNMEHPDRRSSRRLKDKETNSPACFSKNSKSVAQLFSKYNENKVNEDVTPARATRRSTRNFTPQKCVPAKEESFVVPKTNGRITRRTRNTNTDVQQKEDSDIEGSEHNTTYAVETIQEEEVSKESVPQSRKRKSIVSKGDTKKIPDVSAEEETSKNPFVPKSQGSTIDDSVLIISPSLGKTTTASAVNNEESVEKSTRGRRQRTKYFQSEENNSPPVKMNQDTSGKTQDSQKSPEVKTFEIEETPDTQKSPEVNETFEIEETPEHNNTKNVTYNELRRSVRRRTGAETPHSRILNKTSTPKDFSDNKENETSVLDDESNMNDTYEMPIEKNISFSMVRNDEKRRSRSFPRESDVQRNKVSFFSPTKPVSGTTLSQKKGTPINTRIPKFVKKMPDFGSIHKKEFAKMESVVDNHQRKLERAKLLMTPKAVKNHVMVFTAQPNMRQSPLQKKAPTQSAIPTFTAKMNGRFIARTQNAFQPPAPQIARFFPKPNAKEVREAMAKKLPVHNRRENIRQETRTALRGVRLNRRFELQMAHRKMN